MQKQPKVSCPLCGGQLLFSVKADSSLSRKINKDGRLSKIIHQGTRHITDIYYLECDNYKCPFVYNLSYPSNNKTDYQELDEWYEEFGEDFNQLN